MALISFDLDKLFDHQGAEQLVRASRRIPIEMLRCLKHPSVRDLVGEIDRWPGKTTTYVYAECMLTVFEEAEGRDPYWRIESDFILKPAGMPSMN